MHFLKRKKKISKLTFKKLARRGGIKRLSNLFYEEARTSLSDFLKKIIEDAIIYSDYGKRKTIQIMDIIYALKKNGGIFYN
jgi:histone H4